MPAAEFADRAFAALDAVSDDTALRLRSGGVKNLVEEILPLAVFAKYFDAIERRIHCRYLGGSEDEADGELRLSGRAVERGFYPDRILVEATCAEDEKAYLRREALARHGGVFGGKLIWRTAPRHEPGSDIVSEPEVRDGDSGISEMAALVRAAVAMKASKRYAPARLLLVRLDPDFPVNHRKLGDVALQAALTEQPVGLLAVFLVECSTGCVLQA